VTRAQYPAADVLVRPCREANFSLRIGYEASDYQESQAMVAVGLGIALAPQCALSTMRSDIVAVDLGSLTPARRLVLAPLHGERFRPAASELARILVSAGRKVSSGTDGRRPTRVG
jgi:DNA-binding transcriptional LysR family regulator